MVMTTIGTSAVAAITLPMVKLLGKAISRKVSPSGLLSWPRYHGTLVFAFLNLKKLTVHKSRRYH